MDPDRTLEALRAAAARYQAGEDAGASAHDLEDCAHDMAELATALDEWLAKGGFLPKAWARHSGMADFEQADAAEYAVFLRETE